MSKPVMNLKDYRDKVLACWLGKNIGGTLGAPVEWHRQLNNFSFYTQDLGGEPLPNDDLDIQLLWLVALEELGVEIDAHTLAEYWCLYVTPHWAEYGTGKVNMRSGLLPPLSGSFLNEFKDSCGAFIRSEIWACIAPGNPKLAAKYAREDAILDHGNGEGTYAEVFCAALESAAFVVSDLRKLIEIGLSYIPATCEVAKAVHTAIAAYDAGKTWQAAREKILQDYRGFCDAWRTSPEDQAKGFCSGQRGYDVPSNIAILVIGLLYGGENFGDVVCTAVNCGEDTDCTGATAGSIYGLIHGTQAIPQRWIDPIGRTIKTGTLNLGELGYFGNQLPHTVDILSERTETIARQVLQRFPGGPLQLDENAQTDLSGLKVEDLFSAHADQTLLEHLDGPLFHFDFFDVYVDYGPAPIIRNGEPKPLRITIRNTYKTQANLSLQWYVPDGWQVTPAINMVVSNKPWDPSSEVTFSLLTEAVVQPLNRAVLEITIPGRPAVMLVPITLMNGNGL